MKEGIDIAVDKIRDTEMIAMGCYSIVNVCVCVCVTLTTGILFFGPCAIDSIAVS